MKPMMIIPQYPRYSGPRSYLKDCYVLLHLPRFMFIACFIIIGSMMSPHVNYLNLILELIAVSAGVLLTAYRLDELAGHHTSSQIPDSHHKITAIIGIVIFSGIATYLVISVSYYLALWGVLGFIGLVAYNFEIGGHLTHNEFVFALTWAFVPVCASFHLQSGTITPPVVVFGIFTMILATLHIWSYGACGCNHSHTCRELLEFQAAHKNEPFERVCHGMACVNRLFMPREVRKYAWRLIQVQFYLIIALTLFFVCWHYL